MWKDEFDDLKLPLQFDKNEFWLQLEMNDVPTANHVGAPTKEQVKLGLDWVKALPDDAHLVVHCWAGISRSTAMALGILVQKHGIEYIPQAIEWLQENRPIACPNPLVIQHLDELLECRGLLNAAVEKMIGAKIIAFPRRSV